MEKAILEIKNLKFEIENKVILDIPHFNLKEQECFVIFGPNGAGKSSFILIASLLHQPTSGEIYYNGIRVEKSNRLHLRRKASCCLQKPVFFRGSVEDNLLFALKLRRIKKSQQEERLKEVVELFNIKSLLKRSPFELSGGEKQKIHLARAFITKPQILFLDEPFEGLDPGYRERLITDFSRIREAFPSSIVLVTHDRNEAAYLSDRIGVMISGRIVQTASTEEIFRNPATPEVSKLLGYEALVEGFIENSANGIVKISAGGQEIYASGDGKKGDRIILTFRPEEVILARKKPETSVRNWFYGEVKEIKTLDRLIMVKIDCGFNLTACISRISLEELKITAGDKIWAGIKLTAIETYFKNP